MSKASSRNKTSSNSKKDASARSRFGQFALLAIAFLSGAVVLLLEVLASRILAPYLGSSFSVWVDIIGTILAALSVGYYMGGILADRNQQLLPYIFLAAAAACSFVYLGRPLLPHLGALGLVWGSLVAAILFFAPASIVLGMVSPYLLKLAADDTERLGRISGGIYAASTVGSIAGTFAGGFFLIPTFPVSQILIGMIALLLLLSLWCAGGMRRYWTISVSALVLLVLAMQFAGAENSGRTIYEENSQYYNIRVNDVVREGVPLRFLMLDGSTHAARFIDNPDPAVPYVDLSLRIIKALKPNPGSSVALGGGAYSVPELIKRYSPNTDVTVVEIDPEVTATAKQYFLNDPVLPITTFNEDARVFLNENRKQYDVVYTDVYSAGDSVPPALSSKEAFQLMKRAVKPDGVVVLNIFSAREGEAAAVYRALYRTVGEVFPGIAVYTTMPDAPTEPQNMILVASNDKSIADGTDAANIRPFRCRTAPPPGLLLTDDYAPTDYLTLSLARATYPGRRLVQ